MAVDQASVLFERRSERSDSGREARVIFLDPGQRMAFPLGLIPASGAEVESEMVRATLGWKFSLRAE